MNEDCFLFYDVYDLPKHIKKLLQKLVLLPKSLTSDLPVSLSLKLCLASREILLHKPVRICGGYQQAHSSKGSALLNPTLHCSRLLLGACSFEGEAL